MNQLMQSLNTAAVVFGYPVMALFFVTVVWTACLMFRGIAKLIREMSYDRKRQRNEDRDWDNIRSSWVLDMKNDERNTVDHDRHDTDVLGFTREQLYDFQEELRHERS